MCLCFHYTVHPPNQKQKQQKTKPLFFIYHKIEIINYMYKQFPPPPKSHTKSKQESKKMAFVFTKFPVEVCKMIDEQKKEIESYENHKEKQEDVNEGLQNGLQEIFSSFMNKLKRLTYQYEFGQYAISQVEKAMFDNDEDLFVVLYERYMSDFNILKALERIHSLIMRNKHMLFDKPILDKHQRWIIKIMNIFKYNMIDVSKIWLFDEYLESCDVTPYEEPTSAAEYMYRHDVLLEHIVIINLHENEEKSENPEKEEIVEPWETNEEMLIEIKEKWNNSKEGWKRKESEWVENRKTFQQRNNGDDEIFTYLYWNEKKQYWRKVQQECMNIREKWQNRYENEMKMKKLELIPDEFQNFFLGGHILGNEY